MKIVKSKISGCYKLKPDIHKDNRGFFIKNFHSDFFIQNNLDDNFCEDYYSESCRGVLRGMHFQIPPHDHNKMVLCMSGKILDVVIDLNKKSNTFGKIYKFILVDGDTLIVPNNFAHGYECLSNNSIVLYHLDNYRDVNSEKGIFFKDRSLNIKWFTKKPIVSMRDRMNKSFNDLVEKKSQS